VSNTVTPSPTGVNLIPNPSLETVSPTVQGNPASWNRGFWGTNTSTFTYPIAGFDGATGVRVSMSAFTSGDAKWYSNDITVTPGKTYTFSHRYQSTVATSLYVRYIATTGAQSYVLLATLPASATWAQSNINLTIPTGVRSLTVWNILAGVGTLTTDLYSLVDPTATGTGTTTPPSSTTTFTSGLVSIVFDDGWNNHFTVAKPILEASGFKGSFSIVSQYMLTTKPGYMNTAQVLSLRDAGHEINSHTQTHRSLITLNATAREQEIVVSKADLLGVGIIKVPAFVYPFGDFNLAVQQSAIAAGYSGARSVISGYNTKTTDRFALKHQEIGETETIAEIRGWIDTAQRDKTWLILTLHQLNDTGLPYSTAPAILQQTVDYIATKNVPVITLSEGLALMNK
jgi:peptidoglycan/xylan/chitin deacetylase (PgdA/CDA1 family)